MATAPTPTPSSPIACPSCGSRYNPETRELVEDTKLREKIAQLDTELSTLREANAQLVAGNSQLSGELATANEKIATLSQPAPAQERESGFTVWGDD